ncbi:MAG: BlaI/MecI/CopY family transcriptional regulator [Phycisphaerales bacterium]
MPAKPPDLPPAELEVLKVLWDTSPISVRDVMNRLAQQGRDLAYTTVMTFLERLEQKRCVRSRKEGGARLWEPAITRDRVERSRLGTLLDEMYDGAAAPLVLRLVAEDRLTPEEIGELQALIDRLDRDDRPVTGRPSRGRRKGAR